MIKRKKGVYYAIPEIPRVTDEIIKQLFKIAEGDQLDMVRLCLHKNEASTLMAMVIFIRNKYIYPIHRHSWKDESYTVIKGECIYREYLEDKTISKEVKICSGEVLMNDSRTFHSIEPLTDMLCFIEHTVGPFRNTKLEYL